MSNKNHAANKKIIYYILPLIVAMVAVYLILRSIPEQTYVTNLSVGSRPEVELSLATSAREVTKGQTFTVDILLDTRQKAVDGVDIRYLRFDPKLLNVVDSNRTVSGVQIQDDKLLAENRYNRVDNKEGTIAFSQVSSQGTAHTVSGKLATIIFKAMASGTANISFDFTPGQTSDTNVVFRKDILKSVKNLTVTVVASNDEEVTTKAQPSNTVNNPPVVANEAGAELSLSTANVEVTTAQTFDVQIRIDTKDLAIDGVDIYALRFNPSQLSVKQITDNKLLALNVLNQVDNMEGTILFSQVTSGGTTYSGSGVLATITFQALTAGTANVSFDFTPNVTSDTNVAANSKDILKAVKNLVVTIK